MNILVNINESIWQAFTSGFLMQLGMIMSLGMQNLYIIKKGLRKEFPFWIAFTCCSCEIILMLASTTGAAVLISLSPNTEGFLLAGTAAFLIGYGGRSLILSVRKKVGEEEVQNSPEAKASFVGSILAAVGFSLCNPQAILESLVFFGGIAPKFGDFTPYFIAGAISSSFIWLLGLATVTSNIPKEPSPKVMRLLEGTSGCILLTIGVSLVLR